MQDINGNIKSEFNGDYWKLFKKILNGKRTIQQAKFYMLENYLYDGNSRKAFNYGMYAHPNDITLLDKLYNQIEDAIKLGHGKDLNFDNVFR